jgi:hypothetical protein
MPIFEPQVMPETHGAQLYHDAAQSRAHRFDGRKFALDQ